MNSARQIKQIVVHDETRLPTVKEVQDAYAAWQKRRGIAQPTDRFNRNREWRSKNRKNP